jgi:hypothetical protein
MKTKDEYQKVCELFGQGIKKSKIAEIMGLDRGTVRRWITTGFTGKSSNDIIESLILKKEDYSYILGLYLGDGYINKTDRAYRLRICLDLKYNLLNDYAFERLKNLFPNNSVGSVHSSGCIYLYVYNKHLPIMFPQHGSGRKHLRNIILENWQVNMIDWVELLRGLFHSDGSYYFDRGKDYFNFTNLSDNILNLFKMCCHNLGIHYTQTNDKTIRIGKRQDVKTVKELIGTKINMVL